MKIKLTESKLKQIVAESVKNVLKESYNYDDAYMFNYNDAMSDRYETLSIDTILSDLKKENIDLGELPGCWLPANWEDVLQYATEIGYDSEVVKKCILEKLNLYINSNQQSIEAVKNWRFQE